MKLTQRHREWLTMTKPEADRKLRRLGIPLTYTLEFSSTESQVDDDNHVKLRLGDRFGPNWRDKSALNLFLHELAHVFFNRYVKKRRQILDEPETRDLFGDLVKTYKRKPGPKKERPHYYTKYCQSHPEECFAEIFTLYTKNDGDMGKIRHHLRLEGKSTRVYKQVEWMDQLIRAVANGRTPT